MPTPLITTLLVVANVFGAGMALPQAVRLVRTRDIRGLSGVWAGVSVSMNLWWLVYGLANRLWGLVPVSGIALAIYLVISIVYARETGPTPHRTTETRGPVGGRAIAIGIALGMAPTPFLLLGGWTAAGLAIGVGYGLQLLPAVVSAWRTRDLRGIAPSTWTMAWAEAAIWIVYGWYVGDIALLVGGGSGVAMATAILVRLSITGHRPFRMRQPAWALG